MNPSLLLDGLIGLILLLLIPLGLWRGGVRETFVAAGIASGAVLAMVGARSWGDGLADAFGLDLRWSRFAVACLLLLGSTLILGYGGGVMVRPGTPSLAGRTVGGLLSVINGTVFLGLALGFIVEHLLNASAGSLNDGYLTRLLIDDFPLVLAAAASLAALIVIAGLVGRRVLTAAPSANAGGEPDAPTAGRMPRPRPVRVPQAADAGKADPHLDADGIRGRFATASVSASSPRLPRDQAPAPRAMDASPEAPLSSVTPITRGARTGETDMDRWRRAVHAASDMRVVPSPVAHDQSEEATWPPVVTSIEEARRQLQSETPRPAGAVRPMGGLNRQTRPAPGHCLSCAAPVSPSDIWCAECGAPL